MPERRHIDFLQDIIDYQEKAEMLPNLTSI
jgi:hypothetical protein